MAAVNATGSGNWSDPTKWSCNPSLPGAGDTVTLGAYNIVLDQDATVLSLTWTTGTLTVSGNRTLTTAVTIPNNTGYVTTPVGNTLNLVGTMTYATVANIGGTATGAFRVAGTFNQTGNVLSRESGYLVTVANGGVYSLTGNISTTGTVANTSGTPWIYGVAGSSITINGDITLSWTLGYSMGAITTFGTLTYTGSLSIGQNTLTGFYDCYIFFVGGGVANFTINGATFLTDGIGGGNGIGLIYTYNNAVVTVNSAALTLNKTVFYLAVLNNTASVTWTGDINYTATAVGFYPFWQNAGTLVYTGTVTQTSAGSSVLFMIRGGIATINANMTLTPGGGNTFAISASGGSVITYNGNLTLNGVSSGGNGSQALTASGAGTVINMTGNITVNGYWPRVLYASTSGVINLTGNVTLASAGTTNQGIVYADGSGAVTINGDVTQSGTAGTSTMLHPVSAGSITVNGTLKRTAMYASASNALVAYALIYQEGTGLVTINGSIEVPMEIGTSKWLYYVDITKVTWNPGVSGHFTYLNWSFGGNDYPAIANVLSPTSYGFGAFTGTALDISGQLSDTFNSQGYTIDRADNLDDINRSLNIQTGLESTNIYILKDQNLPISDIQITTGSRNGSASNIQIRTGVK